MQSNNYEIIAIMIEAFNILKGCTKEQAAQLETEFDWRQLTSITTLPPIVDNDGQMIEQPK